MRRTLLPLAAVLVFPGWVLAQDDEAASPTLTAQPAGSLVVSLDGENWLLATDAANVGREQHWQGEPPPDTKPTGVPWIIQDAFPGYHGVAWYWHDFRAPSNPHAGGRYLLRFWAVDYRAEVWLNGLDVGGHEGGETPFTLDVTDAVKPNAVNRLAVRVLNPTHTPIDGIVLNETPHRNKVIPYRAGASYNHGGIVDSVELLAVPAVYVDDVFAGGDMKAETVRVQVRIRNASPRETSGRLECTVAPTTGETLSGTAVEKLLPPGDSHVKLDLPLANPRRWELSEPNLYRVTVRIRQNDSRSFDERSVRCGFRDFRFEDGYFRLNGKRLLLKCSHTGNHCPVGLQLPPDPDMLRRDLFNVKVMGFNAIRFIAGMATRYQLDLCDEIGLLVYEEPYGSWCLADSPNMKARYDRGLTEMILRDRNHPSVVIWGLLNETPDGPVFRNAVEALPLVRSLDDTRLVMLNSGRWDLRGRDASAGIAAGSLSNPGSDRWEDVLDDQHPYQHVPHTPSVIATLRTIGEGKNPMFVSEYGVGSAVDLWRVARHYERLGKEDVEDARFYRDKLDRFLTDWDRWTMSECFTSPQDFFAQSIRRMAAERLYGLNALRANPNLVAHSLTGTVDQGMSGEGLFTTFRELKPGTTDAIFEALAPLRLCLFVEPEQVYRGSAVKLEAVLANEDALPPGEYPVRLQAIGPDRTRVFERVVNVTVPAGDSSGEPPLVIPFFSDQAVIDGPAGTYRFLATMERGGAPMGGEAVFHVADASTMPEVEIEVVLWGDDPELTAWLVEHRIRTRPFSSKVPERRELILVSSPPAENSPAAWRELVRHIAQGGSAVFLSPGVFRRGDNPVGWLPLETKGSLPAPAGWLYHKDEWAKTHPVFEGLPCGGMMDYAFYREIIPDTVFSGQEPPIQAIAGANNASFDYSSGLMLAEYRLGEGRFLLNTLLIREHMDKNPVAERLLRNLLCYAGRDAGKPVANLPADFDRQLQAMELAEK
ncbi:MAG: glycoside hydrolase family 2 [Planctomycetaceae bacterium]|nr:glycoside hydrolase family 2 [Planctomycetaceae bacterium]